MKLAWGIRVVLSAVVFGLPAFAGPTNPRNNEQEFSIGYQINAAHTGNVDFSAGFAPPLSLRWSAVTPDSFSAPYAIVADDKVVVTTADTNGYGSQIFALNLKNGRTLWHQLLGHLYGLSTAAYGSGKVYVADDGGQLEALKIDSGKPLWFQQLSSLPSSPSAAAGKVFVGSNGVVFAFDQRSGIMEWSESVDGDGEDSTPTFGGGGIYVAYPDQVYKFSPRTGNPRWHYNGGGDGGGGSTGVYYKGRLYVADPFFQSIVYDAATGAQLGTFSATMLPAFFSDDQGNDYGVALYGDDLYAFSFATGETIWSFSGDGQLRTAPIIINGQVAVGSAEGNLYLLDGTTGTTTWSTKLSGSISGLSAGQGTLIALSGDTVSAFAPEESR
ncbi:MAG TPA: PQQ-binding-like beta-propeller repeat protein [Rhizomicrobium sp.]|jgi:outer membrane protein assembly factor BamB